MISNVSSHHAVSAYSAASGIKPQTGAGAAPETQQLASPASNSNSDKVSISQAGKTLAANENKPPVDITDAKAVAKEHLAQQKLAYEQKQGATTALSHAASSQDSGKAGAAKSPVDITDAKAVAKEHLAQQKLAYEQQQGATTVGSAGAANSSQGGGKAGAAKSTADITDAKAVAKEHLAQQKLAYEQKLAATTAETSTASKQQIGAIARYQNIQSLHG